MLSTNDRDLADFARSFRTHGVSAKGRSLERLGNNYRLPELSAALGLRQLARLAEHTAARNRLAIRYRDELTRLGCGEVLLSEFADRVHAYYKFPVRLPAGKDESGWSPSCASAGVLKRVVCTGRRAT